MRIFVIILFLFSLRAEAQELDIEWDNWASMYNFSADKRWYQQNGLNCDSFLIINPLFDPQKWLKSDNKGLRQTEPPINPFYFDKNCIETYLGKADSVVIQPSAEISIYYLDNCYNSQNCQGFCVAFFYYKSNGLLFYTQRGSYFKN